MPIIKPCPKLYKKAIRCAGHLHTALDPAKIKMNLPHYISILSEYDFDAIAFRGLSGALVAPIVAMEMGKTLLAVRKPHEQSHSIHEVEGDMGARRYVILDDFTSTGKTVYEILQAIERECRGYAHHIPQCIGLFAYLHSTRGLIPAEDASSYWKSREELKQLTSSKPAVDLTTSLEISA